VANKVSLIKIGGNILNKLPLFLSHIKALYEDGNNFIIIHGGGNEVSYWMKRLGAEPKFIRGRRITDESTLKIVEMVLSGEIQGRIISEMKRFGLNTIGINGKSIFYCKKLVFEEADLGFVGEVTDVEKEPILILLEKCYIPVISSIGVDRDGNTYNINADSAALALGISIPVERIIFCTDVPGIMVKRNGKDTLLPKTSTEEGKRLVESGEVSEGMIPKLESAISAIENGVKFVQIWGGDDFTKVWNFEEGTLFYS